MEILQIVPVFSPLFGGPVSVVRSVSRELSKRHHVTVYTTTALDHKHDFENPFMTAKEDGYEVLYFPRILRFTGLDISPTMAIAFRDTLEKYDIVHLHSWRHFQDMTLPHYAKKSGIRYVIQPHGAFSRADKRARKWVYDTFFGCKVLTGASKIIALSKAEVNQCKSMNVPESKIDIVPNGIDLAEYGNLPPEGSLKKKFNIPKDKKIILYLGRIHETKGIDFLVKAYAYLVTRNMICDNVVLVIAGSDDGYLCKLQTLIKAMRVENNVFIVGPLYGKNKLEAYVDAYVYVLPSRYETFPMTVLEAYACEKPVVASRVGGLSDLVLEGVTGLLVEPGSIKQLSSSLVSLLEDENMAKNMGLKGKISVKEKFTLRRITGKLEKLYEEIVDEY